MELKDIAERLCQNRMTVSLVGGGGKTTLLFWLAGECAGRGKKVLVSTTTHIRRPPEGFAQDVENVRKLWAEGRYAVIGTPCREEKLTAPAEELFQELTVQADVVLLEADGAKCHPVKVPAPHEPMIHPSSGLVLGVLGMTALGMPLGECCFRFETQGGWLKRGKESPLDEETAVRILSSPNGTRKSVGDIPYVVILNQCDDEELLERGRSIAGRLEERGIPAICTCFYREKKE